MTAQAKKTDLPSPEERRAPELRAVTSTKSPVPRNPKPRSTSAFYSACSTALEGPCVVWDVGCGDGQGTALLAGPGRIVVGIDPLQAGSLDSTGSNEVTFTASLPQVHSPEQAPDLIVVSDTLGYVEAPDFLLLQLSTLSKPTTKLLLWEPRAEPTQQLPPAKRRAFSQAEAAELLAASGWHVSDSIQACESYVTFVATRAPAEFVKAVSRLVLGLPEESSLDEESLDAQLAGALDVRRAQNALLQKNGNAATSHFFAALRRNPTHTGALCGVARLALACGSTSDALHFVRTCLEVDPTNIQAQNLWVSFLDAASPTERIAAHQTLANLAPTDATALSDLAQLHAENDPLLAIQDLERLRRHHPEPSLALSLTLGWLLYSVGRHSDAEVEARLASLMDPDGPDTQELLQALTGSRPQGDSS